MTLHRWSEIQKKRLRMPLADGGPRRRRWPVGCRGRGLTRGQRRRFSVALFLRIRHSARSRH